MLTDRGYAWNLYSVNGEKVINYVTWLLRNKEVIREATEFDEFRRGVIYWMLDDEGNKLFPIVSYVLFDRVLLSGVLKGIPLDLRDFKVKNLPRTVGLDTMHLIYYLATGQSRPEDITVGVNYCGHTGGMYNLGAKRNQVKVYISKIKEIQDRGIIREATQFSNGSRGIIWWVKDKEGRKKFPIRNAVLFDSKKKRFLDKPIVRLFDLEDENLNERTIPRVETLYNMQLVFYLATGRYKPEDIVVNPDILINPAYRSLDYIYRLNSSRIDCYISQAQEVVNCGVVREATEFSDGSRGLAYWKLTRDGRKHVITNQYVLFKEGNYLEKPIRIGARVIFKREAEQSELERIRAAFGVITKWERSGKSDKAIERYNQIAVQYNGLLEKRILQSYWNNYAVIQRLRQLGIIQDGSNAVSLLSGPVVLGRIMKELGLTVNVLSVDYSPGMLSAGSDIDPDSIIYSQVLDAPGQLNNNSVLCLNLNEDFSDAIISQGYGRQDIVFVSDIRSIALNRRKEFIKQARELLRPGGYLVFIFREYERPGNKFIRAVRKLGLSRFEYSRLRANWAVLTLLKDRSIVRQIERDINSTTLLIFKKYHGSVIREEEIGEEEFLLPRDEKKSQTNITFGEIQLLPRTGDTKLDLTDIDQDLLRDTSLIVASGGRERNITEAEEDSPIFVSYNPDEDIPAEGIEETSQQDPVNDISAEDLEELSRLNEIEFKTGQKVRHRDDGKLAGRVRSAQRDSAGNLRVVVWWGRKRITGYYEGKALGLLIPVDGKTEGIRQSNSVLSSGDNPNMERRLKGSSINFETSKKYNYAHTETTGFDDAVFSFLGINSRRVRHYDSMSAALNYAQDKIVLRRGVLDKGGTLNRGKKPRPRFNREFGGCEVEYEAHLIDRLEDGQLTTDEIITRVRILRNAEIVRDEKLPTVKDNKDGRLMFSFKNIRRERFNSLEDVTVSLQLDKNGYLSIADIKRRAPEEFAESWVEITSNKGNLTGNIVFIEDKDGKPILDKEGKPLAVSVEANILEQVRSRREPADEGMISIYDTKTGEFITACNGLSKEEFDSLEDVEIVTTLGKNGQLRIGGNNRRNFTLFPEAKVKFRVISGEISILTFLSDKQGNPVSVRDGEPLEVDFREDMYSQLRNRISGYRGQPVRASGKIYESKKELSEGMKEALIGREVPIKIAEYVRKSLTNRSGGGITAWQQRISDFRISGLISKIQEQSIRALYEGRADRFDMERFADTIFENVNRFKQDSESYTDIQIGIILGRGLSYRRYQRMRRAYPELTKTGFIDALYQNINYKDSLSSRHKRRNNRIDNISLIKSALISSGISEEFAERLTVVLVNKNVFRVRLVRKRFLDNGLLTEKQIKILSYLESCPPKEFNAEFKPSEFAKLALKEMDKFKSATGNLRFAANQVEQLLVKGYTLRRFVALIQKYGLTKRIVYRIVKKYSNPEPVLEKLNKKIVSLNKLHNLPLYIIREIAYQGKEVEAGIDSIASYAQANGTSLSLAYNLYSFYQLDESSIREAIRVLSREYSGLSNNYLSRVQTFIDEIESLAAAIEALKQNDEKGLLSPRERLARVKELKPVAGIEALMKIVLTGSYYHARQLVTETCRVKNSEYEWESPTINVDPATLNAAREIMAAQDRINGAKSLIESKWREFVPYLEKFEQKEKVILLRAADIYLRSGIYSGLNTPEVLGIIGEVGLDDFINKFIVVLLYQKGTARIKRLLRMTQSGLLTQGQKSILLNEDFTQLPKNLETEELIKRLYENIILFAREGNFSRTLITDIIVNGGYSWQTINELLLTFSNLSRKKLREAMKSKDPDRYLFTHFGLVKHYVDEAERAVKSGRDLDEGQLFALIINGRIHKGDLRAGQLNTQALNIIVDRNQLLIEELARKYSPSYELYEEFLSIAKSALLEAAWEYTPVYNQKDGFLEYARAVMEQ
ncbi:MAG: class I SAM-dependent methyltransferase, partial [Candidatus Omnitrophica bacterium]|nr:class I SAM-dependent methyltransferase [Candidatus Omnitrophota bacterium]